MATSLVVGDGTPEAYFREGVKANVREDGRENSEFRKVVVEQGVVDHASGSAQVALGRTKVLAAATLEIGSPREGRPSAGVKPSQVKPHRRQRWAAGYGRRRAGASGVV